MWMLLKFTELRKLAFLTPDKITFATFRPSPTQLHARLAVFLDRFCTSNYCYIKRFLHAWKMISWMGAMACVTEGEIADEAVEVVFAVWQTYGDLFSSKTCYCLGEHTITAMTAQADGPRCHCQSISIAETTEGTGVQWQRLSSGL